MTPAQALAEAKSRFMLLPHDDPEALEKLLRQALGKMEEKAGVLVEVWSETPMFDLPPHFRSIASCCDTRRRFAPFRICHDSIGEPHIKLQLYDKHEPPYCLTYFCDLRNWDADEDLPGQCDALLVDYLEALIAVQNTQRQREAYLTTGMQTAAGDLQSTTELKQRIADLEQEMENSKAIIPPASYF